MFMSLFCISCINNIMNALLGISIIHIGLYVFSSLFNALIHDLIQPYTIALFSFSGKRQVLFPTNSLRATVCGMICLCVHAFLYLVNRWSLLTHYTC